MGSLPTDGQAAAPEALRPREAERGPLSYGQQRLWFLDRWLGGRPVYNSPGTLRFTGPLDADRLAAAVAATAARHDVLFTVIEDGPDGPRQRVLKSRELACPIVDLTHLSLTEARAEAQRLIDQDAKQPFDLANGPMLRAHLFRVADDAHWLHLTCHHIAFDGWSLEVFQRQLVEAYRADGTPALPPAVQYADYALWQRETMEGRAATRALENWARALADAPAVLDLGADRPRPAELSYRGRTESFPLDGVPLAQLEKLAADEGVTLYVVLLAAFQALVARHAGRDDIVLGSPTSGRGPSALDELVGYFVDLLVIRTSLAEDPTFRALLGRTRVSVIDALSRSKVPFDMAVNHLHPERNLSYNPVVQAVLQIHEDDGTSVLADGVEIERAFVPTDTAKYDVTWSVYRSAEGLRLEVEYATDLFDAATVRAFVGHWETLLNRVVADPDVALSDIDLATADEAAQILQWSGEKWQLPGGLIHELVAQSATATPDAIAVTCAGESLTYAELDGRATTLARKLRTLGVGPERCVGVLTERSLDTVTACLAILKAGGVYVPLDIAFPADRMAFMLEGVAAPVVLVHKATAHLVPEGDWSVIDIADTAGIAESTDDFPSVSLDNGAYVIYTSGSTGRPKGTMVTHRNVVRLIQGANEKLGFTTNDVWSVFHSFAFDVSVFEMWGGLTTGGRLVVVPYALSRDAEAFHALVCDENVTILSQTPSAFRQFETADEAAGGELALRAVIFAGEALHRPSLRRWASRHGYESPLLVNMYGITETTVHTTYLEMAAQDLEHELTVVGGPLPDLSLYVLDAHGRPCPAGVTGEIHVGGAGVTRGYHGRPELTAERFVPDHVTGQVGARLYKSGDLARWTAQGELEYVGRSDFQVKIRGYRIETGEIEAHLSAHPQLREAVVIARTGPDGQADLAAYLVLSSNASRDAPAADELRAWLRTRIPDYMVPRHFVFLDALPLTAQGKLDRRALPEPQAVRPQLAQEFIAPLGDVEETLAEIWGRVLGVDRVGRHDNFFDLGGDSIRSIQVLGQARVDGLGFEIQDLFRSPTIAGLATVVQISDVADTGSGPAPAAVYEPFSMLGDEDRALLPEGLQDAYPMAELQVGMVYEMELNSERRAYLNVDGLRIVGPFDEACFREATARVIARHPILRTGFDLSTYSEPMQLVYPTAEMPFVVDDLRHLDSAAQDELLDEYVNAERNRPFDHSRPTLLRFALHRLTDESFSWTLTEHHAIFDGWSLHSTMAEISDVYQKLLAGEDPVLTPPVSAYRDFIAAERETVRSEESRQYWLERINDRPETKLPRWGTEHAPRLTGREQPNEWRDYHGEQGIGTVETLLPEALCDELRELARQCGVPFKAVLLAAHLKVVSVVTGSTDLLVGVTVNGRMEDEDSTDVRGMFLNTAPFRIKLPDGTWRDLITAVFETERELLPHRRYPFGAIQRELGGAGLVDVNFVHNHFHVLDKAFGPGQLRIVDDKIDSFTVDRVEPTNFALNVGMIRNPYSNQVIFGMDYHTEVLNPDQVLLYRDYYVRAFEAMVADPGAEHQWVSLLGPDERALLTQWSGEQKQLPGGTVHELVAQAAAERPDAVAVTSAGESLTYAELEQRAATLARRLRSLGVGPEACVGVCMARSLDMVVACLAILKAGGVYVPLDTAFPADRMSFMLDEVNAKVVLVHEPTAAAVPEGTWRFVNIDNAPEPDETNPTDADTELPAVHPENGCYVIFTSGSTGRPKGTTVAHRNVVRLIQGIRELLPFGPEDVWTVFHSFAFDFSVWEMWGGLMTGGRVVVVPHAVTRDTEAFHALVRDEKVTILSQTPSAFRQFETADEQSGGDLALRAVIFGGEALHRPSVRRWASRHGYAAPLLVNMYGITETTVHVTYQELAEADLEGEFSQIGRPLPDLSVHVLDEHGRPCPVGVTGEIHVGGAGITRGYTARPGLTAERFVPDHLSGQPGGRLYRSGDLARWTAQGKLEYVGRGDAQVKIRGYRIETGEIETVLGTHPQLLEATVIARTGTDGQTDLIGYLVPLPDGATPAPDELRSWLGRRLPGYMVPRHLVFLDTLPLTAQGKVDRRALPEPQTERPDFSQEFIAPVGPVEELLAEIWGRVLGVDRVGRDDNFFDLGGDSIRGLQVVGQARSTGMNVRLQDINRYPTLGTLAEITEQLKATAPAVTAKPAAKPSPFALLSERDRARLAARGSSTK